MSNRPDPRVIEPSPLDSFVSGSIRRIIQRQESLVDTFVVDETITSERLIFKVCTQAQSIEVVTVFKEPLFAAKGDLLSDTSLRVKRCDEYPIDWINLEIRKSVYTDEDNLTSKCHDFYHSEDNYEKKVARVFWDDVRLRVVLASITMNIHEKAFILIRMVQLANNFYADRIGHKLNRSPYITQKIFRSSPLFCLQSLSDGEVELDGKLPGNQLRCDLRCARTNMKILFLEYHYDLEELVAKDDHGVPQFYVYGIEDPTKTLIVNTHSKKTIGAVYNNMQLCDADLSTKLVIRAKSPEKALYIPVMIEDNSNSVAAAIDYVTAEYATFRIYEKMAPEHKALILSQLMRILFNTYEYGFRACMKPIRHYTPYCLGDTDKPSTLHSLDKLRKLYIRSFGSCSRTGVVYIEVRDYDKYENTVLVFEARHRIGRVEAVCKDSKGKLQFSAFGVWGMKNELEVCANSGNRIGSIKNFQVFNYDGQMLADIVSSVDPESAKKRFQSDLPIILYQFIDRQEDHEPKTLAQINEGAHEVEVLFDKDAPINVEYKALAICFGVRLLYELDLHKTPMTDIAKYSYEKEQPASPDEK